MSLCDEHNTSQNLAGEPCWVCLHDDIVRLEAENATLKAMLEAGETPLKAELALAHAVLESASEDGIVSDFVDGYERLRLLVYPKAWQEWRNRKEGR